MNPGTTNPGVYEERHAALNRKFLSYALAAISAAPASLVASIVVSPGFAVALGGALMPFLMSISVLYRNWPTGIRIDETGITFGAIGSRRAARRHLSVNHQSWGLFHCPWSSVQNARVIADPEEVLSLRKSPEYYTMTNRYGIKPAITHCNTGVLSSPWMSAALVLEIRGQISYPRIRPARFYNSLRVHGYFSRKLCAELSPTWVVPTRHPDRLWAALDHWKNARHAGAERGACAETAGTVPDECS